MRADKAISSVLAFVLVLFPFVPLAEAAGPIPGVYYDPNVTGLSGQGTADLLTVLHNAPAVPVTPVPITGGSSLFQRIGAWFNQAPCDGYGCLIGGTPTTPSAPSIPYQPVNPNPPVPGAITTEQLPPPGGTGGGTGGGAGGGSAGGTPDLGGFPDLVANQMANAMCEPYIPKCGCDSTPTGPNGQCVTKPHSNLYKCPVGACFAVTNGEKQDGICVGPNRCQAIISGGKGLGAFLKENASVIGLSLGLGGMLLGQLKSSGGSGGNSGGGSPYYQPQSYNYGPTCTTYTAVSDPKLVTSSSCTYYVPNTPTTPGGGNPGGGTCSSVDQLLGNCGGTTPPKNDAVIDGTLSVAPLSGAAPLSVAVSFADTSDKCPHAAVALNYGDGTPAIVAFDGKTSCGQSEQQATHTFTKQGTYQIALIKSDGSVLRSASVNVNSSSGSSSPDISNDTGNTNTPAPANPAPSGPTGDIKYFGTGATFIASKQDNNSATAGFYGGIGATAKGLVTQLCTSRPWSSGFLSAIIPASFFDSLCTSRGFSVGQPAASAPTPQTPQVQLVQTPVAKKQKSSPSTSKKPSPSVVTTITPPQIQIWAAPPSVPLGTRTTILWTVDNPDAIQSCLVSSPDGSFSHTVSKDELVAAKTRNSISNASTVPLSGETTFTISCLTIDGKHVTNFVTVKIAS